MNRIVLLIVIILLSAATAWTAGIEKIEYGGWKDSYRISNGVAEVIIVPALGGRVVSYSIDGRNVLWENPKVFAGDGKTKDYSGYTLDLAPEAESERIPGRGELLFGEYDVKILGQLEVRLTSPEGEAEMQLIKEIRMDPKSSQVIIRQRMINISDRGVKWGLWDRTLLDAPCLVFFPLKEKSKFPEKYIDLLKRFHGKASALIGKQWKIKDNLMIMTFQGGVGKIGSDSDHGWIAYAKEELVYVKEYPCFPEEEYPDEGCRVEVYVTEEEKDWSRVELEPLSPLKRLRPGEEYTFTQIWHLFRYKKPVIKKEIEKVRKIIEARLGGP